MAGDGDPRDAREFHVQMSFAKAARPGGLSREQALKNAEENIEVFKPGFEEWLDAELGKLLQIVSQPPSKDATDLRWIEAADRCSQRLADVAGTMGYQFMSFVANNLCMLFDALRQGAEYREDVIACHVDALLLSRQRQYQRIAPGDLPELTEGLSRLLETPRLQPPGKGESV